MKKFKYLGVDFQPYMKLKGKNIFESISKKLGNIDLTPKNWSYDRFYKVAKSIGADNIDLFIIEDQHGNEVVVIPGTNYLFRYPEKIKGEIMRTYLINAQELVFYQFEINANSPEEAKKLVENDIDGNLDYSNGDAQDFKVISVEEKK